MENKFMFKNFVPTTSTHRYCARKFSRMWGDSPSDSNISATIIKNPNQLYKTIIKITSSRHAIQCEVEDEAILVSVGLAMDKVHESISMWKRQNAIKSAQ